MAIVININHTDTAISGATAASLTLPVVNFPVDFRVKQDEPGEAIITNLTSPVDAPERYRFGVSDIKDIYANSGIEYACQAPLKRGKKVFVQLTEVLTKTDSIDTTYKCQVPLAGHIVLSVPQDADVTDEMIITFLKRLVAGLFDPADNGTTRLKCLERGSLIPSGM